MSTRTHPSRNGHSDRVLLPPQDKDAERAYIGSASLMPSVLDDYRIDPNDLYLDQHRVILRAMLAMHQRGEHLDFITIGDELARAGQLEDVGGDGYLTEILNSTPHAGHAKSYARITRAKAERRAAIYRCIDATKQLYDETIPPADILAGLNDANSGDSHSSKSSALNVVCLSDVTPKTVEWLWPQRWPMGHCTLLAGNPGLGKSYVTLDAAARVSVGCVWPDGSGHAPQGEVIILAAEDGLADTIRPRLDTIGADVSKVFCIQGTKALDAEGKVIEGAVRLDRDLLLLDQLLQSKPDVRLLIIDPVSEYMGAADSHKNADVRGVLGPLSKLAERHNIAVLNVTHLSNLHCAPCVVMRGVEVALGMWRGSSEETVRTFVARSRI